MMSKLKYIVLGLPLLLGSCETVVEVELPAQEPQLVVNAVINPDSLFKVDVSASRSPFSNDAHSQLYDATVQVYQAGQFLFDLQHVGNGMYKADREPQALQHYELHVSAPSFPDASAANYIPSAPVLTDVQASKAPHDPDMGPAVNLTLLLEDAPHQENFYYIQAYTQDSSYNTGELYNRYSSVGFTTPIESEFSMESRYFFSDKLFNGKALQLVLHLQNDPQKLTYVQVAHITKEYYQYVRTLKKQAGGDDFGKFPTAVANNIRGGMGIFAGYNAVTLAVKP